MKKVFCQTYILYDKSGMVNPTFVSELQQYVNSFPQVIIFCGKSDKNLKNFAEKQQFFFSVEKKLHRRKKVHTSVKKTGRITGKNFFERNFNRILNKARQSGRKKNL